MTMNIVTESHISGRPIAEKPAARPVRLVRWFIIVGLLLTLLVGGTGTAQKPAADAKAAATPQRSLPKVTLQPLARSSSQAFPMITGWPANSSISTSLWLSPMAMT